MMKTATSTTTAYESPAPIHQHHAAAVAGYAAGVSGTLVGYPMDTLKLWMQTNRFGESEHWNNSNSKKKASPITAAPETGGSSKMNTVSAVRYGQPLQQQYVSLRRPSSSTIMHITTAGHRMNSTLAPTNGVAVLRLTPSSITMSSSTSTSLSATSTVSSFHKLQRIQSNLKALYSGVSVPLITVGIVQSVNFATYDSVRRYLFTHFQGNGCNKTSSSSDYRTCDPIHNVAFAGLISGSVTAFVTAPLVLIKTHQQITGSSFRQAVQQTLLLSPKPATTARQSGGSKGSSIINWRGCRAGMIPHLLCETVGRSVYYATYECLKRIFAYANNTTSSSSSTGDVTLYERMFCAATSGIICWGVVFPLDSLRSRIYSEYVGNGTTTATNSSNSTKSLVQMIRRMQTERSFYRGFGITVLRAGPVAAVVLPVYDFVLDSLSAH
jgi:solute carrier family 25 (mitochondrial carnitine/acylcarnitine transporter), member 20/29